MLYIHHKSNPKPEEHNYLKRVAELGEEGLLENAVFINVGHDAYCGVFGGHHCNCDPEITVVRAGFNPAELPDNIREAMQKNGLL